MDVESGTILKFAEISMIPLIVGIIQAAKRFAPNAHDNVWFGSSLGLGVLLQVLVWGAINGWPMAFATILALVLAGLAFGLAAGKAWDQAKKMRGGGKGV